MPRQKRLRKIVAPPEFSGYKPFGKGARSSGEVKLLYEEYEAIKLADYDMMYHGEAAELMGVSRPTFARIYESARQKVAKAFVESKTIQTTYGSAWLEKGWYGCSVCKSKFTLPSTHESHLCPICKSGNIGLIDN